MALILFQQGFLAFLVAWVAGMLFYPWLIDWQRKRQLGQKIKKEGPNLHLHKENTPSMGGMVILIGLVLTGIFQRAWIARWAFPLVVLGLFTALGLYDDYFKSFLEKPWGIKARIKFITQVVLSCGVMSWVVLHHPTDLSIPFTQITIALGRPLFFLFGVFILLASSNAFNITDGLDGLAGGCGVLSFLFWGWVFFLNGAPLMMALNLAVAGILVSFLWFNVWPARIFMGDSGALGLGALLGLMALLSGQALLFVFCGLIFVIETLSVIIQVISFKLFRKRVFLMSPLHHHFELRGWKESQITLRFWMLHAVGVVIAVLGIRG